MSATVWLCCDVAEDVGEVCQRVDCIRLARREREIAATDVPPSVRGQLPAEYPLAHCRHRREHSIISRGPFELNGGFAALGAPT